MLKGASKSVFNRADVNIPYALEKTIDDFMSIQVRSLPIHTIEVSMATINELSVRN